MAFGNPDVAATADELLQRNIEAAKTHDPLPFFAERPDSAPLPKVFIFCCFDPRVDPIRFLGLNPWDALLVRNVGGNVTSQLENLIYVDHLLGSFTDVFVIQHTNCGATLAKNGDVRDNLRKSHMGTEPQIEGLWLPAYENIDQRVRDNVQIIKESPFIRDELKARTQGLIYDLKTGKVEKVD